MWVDIDSRLFDPAKAHRMYNDFMDELEFAAEIGFDGICVNEHHSNGYGLMPSPNLIAASLARRTRDAAIVVMGNSLALYNPPTRVAEEFAMLDVISGGRLVAGFPVGTPMDTCFAYGQNPSQLRDRYHEAHDLMLRCWTEPDTFAWNGRYNKQRYVNPWPRPLQKPHPPIWIPGGGSIETWQLVRGDGLRLRVPLVLRLQGRPGHHAAASGTRWSGSARTRNPFRAGFLQFVGVAETREEALELYREPAEYFFNRCLHVDARWANPARLLERGDDARARGLAGARRREQGHRRASRSARRRFEEIVDKGYVIIGSPDEVAEKLREVAVNMNVGQLMLLAAVRQHEQGARLLQHGALRQARRAAAAAICSRTSGRTAGGRSRSRARSAASRARWCVR